MTDFLLELRSEEIPARMQAGARAELDKLFRREMASAGVDVADVTIWSTPRRLALIARGLPDATAAVSEEAKGPPEGAPDAALEGFCRKNGVRVDQLQLRDVKGRNTWFAVIDRPGRATKDVLADAIPAIVRDFAWPKSMRWGAASIRSDSPRWVRPLSGIVAILGENLVECEAAGVRSGYATLGHRFHCPGEITIGGAQDYAEKLRACHVIVDHEERAALIYEGARKAASEAGLTLVEDEGLVTENAGLTEWPVPLLGRFDEAFLDVPPEVIQLTARVNQKYFVLQESPPLGEVAAQWADGGGAARATQTPSDPSAGADGPPPPEWEARLANAFICTANIAAQDGGAAIIDGGAAIIDGNRKVLAARLSDARFFWEQDRKKTLAQHAEGLARITFHEKLGTIADKVERVAKLAKWLVESDIVVPAKAGTAIGQGATLKAIPASAGMTKEELAEMAEQAARLCKADLVTEMVGEFPELQGLMGGYYARAEGLPEAVSDAIRDHYKPVGQGDQVPTAPVTVAVSLADKLDTLITFFAIGEVPTGSKDPFALRRAAISVIELISKNELRHSLSDLKQAYLREAEFKLFATVAEALVDKGLLKGQAAQMVGDFMEGKYQTLKSERVEIASPLAPLISFFADRLKVQQREAGVRHDLIDAVFALGGEDDLVRLLERVKALQNYIETAEGADLLAAYKRAANILKKEDWRGTRVSAPHTGEEDPLSQVDDPDLMAVISAKMADARAKKTLSYTPEPAEDALIAALDSAEPRAAQAVEAEDFEGAMAALASLRAPIDRFFDEVTVNDTDPDKRAARLDLLLRFRDAVHRVADFSRIEG